MEAVYGHCITDYSNVGKDYGFLTSMKLVKDVSRR
jgi:hypothetical protein